MAGGGIKRLDLVLIALLTVLWGFNWPIMKMGMQDFPPWLFRTITLTIGFITLGLFLRWKQFSLVVPRQHWLTVLYLAIPSMLIWHVVSAYAIRNLSSGRVAILGYTMPIWVVIITVFLLKQRLSARQWAAVACMTIGVVALLWDEAAKLSGKPLWAAAAMFCGLSWAWGTMAIKRDKSGVSILVLTFWMLLCGIVVNLLLSLAFETAHWRGPTTNETWAMLYTGIIAMGFAQTAFFFIASRLPPIVSGISVMLVPVVGVMSGAWMLGEVIRLPDWLALMALSFAIVLVNLPQAKKT